MGNSRLYNLYTTPTVSDAESISHQELIVNDHEPIGFNDPPIPENANFYRADDHVYYHINGQWKRTPLSSFNNPT